MDSQNTLGTHFFKKKGARLKKINHSMYLILKRQLEGIKQKKKI